MRLFIGLELPREIRTELQRTAEDFRERLGRARVRPVIRWVPEENLHITIWFFGEVPDERALALKDALAAPLTTPRFGVRLSNLGAFPPAGPPRVLWAGLKPGEEAVRAIHGEMAARLRPLGYEPEARPFTAHITIGRVKDVPRGTAAAFRQVLDTSGPEPIEGTISTVTLFRSHTSPAGSQYEPLLRVPLK